MILCGTDLSPASEPALQAAAAYAKKHSAELLLVHVVSSLDSQAVLAAELQLEQDAAALRRNYDISVDARVVQGAPDERLLGIAHDTQATLIVVAALGSSGRKRVLGSVPERLRQNASVPVLIARDAAGLEAWSKNQRQLKVMLGSGLGDASSSALRELNGWSDLAVTVAHVAWPYGEHYRLGVGLPMPLDHLRPEVHSQLLGDLGRWANDVGCRHDVKLRVAPGWGRIDSHLAQLAQEKEVDLMVVGNHQRNLAARLWHGSISRQAIHEASCNVLCVPHVAIPTRVASPPRAVVVPTDFSVLSDRAIAIGCSLLERGGCVHLVHVATTQQAGQRDAALEKLKARLPSDLASRGLQAELQVLEGSTPWLAIWQYAGRANADLICMGTHSNDAVKNLMLGSQAQALLQHSRIPVVLVPPDRES
jgi:nucleotide-binding universal stress UspA family protein